MGMKFRRSVKIAPGVKVNFNKKSVGVTVGGKAAKVTVNSKGRVTASAKTPVKGLYYSESVNLNSNKSKISMNTNYYQHKPKNTANTNDFNYRTQNVNKTNSNAIASNKKEKNYKPNKFIACILAMFMPYIGFPYVVVRKPFSKLINMIVAGFSVFMIVGIIVDTVQNSSTYQDVISDLITLIICLLISTIYNINKAKKERLCIIQKENSNTLRKQNDASNIHISSTNQTDLDDEYLNSVLEDGKTVEQHMKEDFDEAMKKSNMMDEQEDIKLNDMEADFIKAFLNILKPYGLDTAIRYNRMSNGVLNFTYKNMQIGRIKLRGKKMNIQVLYDASKGWEVKYFDVTSLEDATIHIDEWVEYLQFLIKDERI